MTYPAKEKIPKSNMNAVYCLYRITKLVIKEVLSHISVKDETDGRVKQG
jgi:hypothetical protein